MKERLCVVCGINPVPYLPNGLQSTWLDNCDACSALADIPPVQKKRGVRRGQKIERHKKYRVYVMGGIDEATGRPRVMFEQEYKRFDREAVYAAKDKLRELHGLYSVVVLYDYSNDTQTVVARYEWVTQMKIKNVANIHTLKVLIGD